MKTTSIQLFEKKQVRSVWDEEEEKWYFSIIDVIEILTENSRPRKYWSDLKAKLAKEGSEVSDKIGRLKMTAPDGKIVYQRRHGISDIGKNTHVKFDNNFDIAYYFESEIRKIVLESELLK